MLNGHWLVCLLVAYALFASGLSRAESHGRSAGGGEGTGDNSEGIPRATSAFLGEKSVMKTTREGIFLVNREDTYVGRSLSMYGEWCVSEVDMFKRIVKEGDVVLDVGANIGAFTVPLAKMVGSRGAVVAFEPQRQVYQLLNANIALNELTNCWAYHKGVGAQGGSVITPKVNYSVSGNFGGISLLEEENWGDRGPVEVVEVVRLDDVRRVLTKCPSFVKIDVEGMEVDVVRGGLNMIKECAPVIHVENNCKRGSKELIELVGGVGGDGIYEIFWDIHTYFNPNNFFGHKEDIFSDGLLSMNLICVPKHKRVDLVQQLEKRGMVKVDVERGKFYLHDYVLNWKGKNIVIEQLGDMEKCKR